MRSFLLFPLLMALVFFTACKQKAANPVSAVTTILPVHQKSALCCESNIPVRFATLISKLPSPLELKSVKPNTHKGMVWIKAGTFLMGGDNTK